MIRNPGHVAVVGCGFTGTVALRELVNNHRVRRVTVLERSGRFGPGFAYAPDECLDYLLNNRTDTMPIAVDDRTSFLAWLQARPERFGPVPADGHVPRAWFGEFLLHCVQSTLQVARERGIEVRLVPEEVVGLDRGPGSLLVLRTPSGTIEADAVLLATGRCPSAPPYPAPARARPDRWFSGHVNAPRLDALPGDATVHVLGSSLSALDVVHRLFGTATGARFVRDDSGKLHFEDGGNQRRVVLCSRSGALPALQSQRAATLSRTVTGRRALLARARCGGIDLLEARARIQAEAREHGVPLNPDPRIRPVDADDAGAADRRARTRLEAALEDARSAGGNFLVDLYSDAQLDLWDAWLQGLLTPEAEAQWRAGPEARALPWIAPAPMIAAERVLALHDAGRLRLVAGVEGVETDDPEGAITILTRFGPERASYLVDTTGQVDRDPRSPRQSALIRHLVARGWLRPHVREGRQLPGAAVDPRTLELPDAPGVFLLDMFLWGPAFWTSSALVMAAAVRRVLGTLYPPTETSSQAE